MTAGRALPGFHVVTDDRVLADDGFGAAAREVLEAGTSHIALHLRGPESSGRRLHDLARGLIEVADETGALLLVNDRVDVASAVGAHGVHLPGRSIPVPAARSLLPEGSVVGASVHDGDEMRRRGEADFFVFGTIFATPSHPGRPGAGPEAIFRVRSLTSRPVLAIGGVTPERVDEVIEAGADGVVALRGVWNASAPGLAVREYLDALAEGGAA